MFGSLFRSTLRSVGFPTAAIVLALGCSQRSDPPRLSQNAGLASLTVQGGVSAVTPAFAPGTFAYTLKTNYGSTPGSRRITATLADPKATMTLAGAALSSGTPSAALPLKVGTNTLTLVVTAQDGSTTQTYTITEQVNAPNTTVYVLDASTGSPMAGAFITLADASGTILQSGLAVDATGKAMLGLDGTSVYNLSAQAPGSAQALLLGFDASRETVAHLHCQPLGGSPSPATPQSTGLSYDLDGKAWPTRSGNGLGEALGSLGTFSSETTGERTIDPPERPRNDRALEGAEEPASPLAAGTNNRGDLNVHLSLTDGAGDPTQPDLSSLSPSGIVVQTHSRTPRRNGLGGPPGPGPTLTEAPTTTFEAELSFSLLSASAEAQLIAGFEVYRSPDSKVWTRVATNQYAALTLASRLSWSDKDPSLQAGKTYYYMVRCFNRNTTHNGGYSQYSAAGASKTLPLPRGTALADVPSGTRF